MHVAIYDDSTNDRKSLQALATENGHGIERLPLQRTCISACMEQELIFKTVLHHDTYYMGYAELTNASQL
ncbi:MAG: hypothetical protein VB047_01510 [Anaerotignum propionicum]|uniref:hypothetical protein n=1 Tax=Anaerotignum propionicum TaxID=28446 RepID=UPI002B221371|nr:hypothetical protein [Anaerotignum propionicum]MEA5056226.1 hypothetical protein [Anaerotignum propionicum]